MSELSLDSMLCGRCELGTLLLCRAAASRSKGSVLREASMIADYATASCKQHAQHYCARYCDTVAIARFSAAYRLKYGFVQQVQLARYSRSSKQTYNNCIPSQQKRCSAWKGTSVSVLRVRIDTVCTRCRSAAKHRQKQGLVLCAHALCDTLSMSKACAKLRADTL
eukprot:20064-Heterococcus_DN1.PRE.3